MRDNDEQDREEFSDALLQHCGEYANRDVTHRDVVELDVSRPNATSPRFAENRVGEHEDSVDIGNETPYDPYSDPRFARWLEQHARIKLSPQERGTNSCVAASFAVRVHRNIKVANVRAKIPVSELRVRDADTVGTIGQVARAAAKVRCAPWFDSMAVAAGVGREMWDEPCERWVELPRGVPRSGHVAVNVAGDSMIPVLHAGDVLLVKVGAVPRVGTLVVARHADDGYVVKYVSRIEAREIELESFNPTYAPFTIANDHRLIVGTVSHVLRTAGMITAG